MTDITATALAEAAPCRYCQQEAWLADDDGPLHTCCEYWAAELAAGRECPACHASAALAVRQPGHRMSREDQELYRRCLCGISLWATEGDVTPWVWARHLAHIEAFQQSAMTVLGAIVLGELTGPCARCGKDCERYGEHGGPLCGDCQPAQDVRPEQPGGTTKGTPA